MSSAKRGQSVEGRGGKGDTSGTTAAAARKTNPFHEIRKRELRCQRQWTESRVAAAGSMDSAEVPAAVPSYFVPSLMELCAGVIANTFEDQRDIEGLRDLDKNLYKLIVDQLRTDLPLAVSVPRVREPEYWRSCCEDRWSLGQLHEMTLSLGGITKVGDQWKRVFLEQHLAEKLMSLRGGAADAAPGAPPAVAAAALPTEAEDAEIAALCALCASEVQCLRLTRMRSRLNLAELLGRLPHLREFFLSYGVLDAGVEFTPDMVGMREDDANRLQVVLKSSSTLTSISLPENAIDDDLSRALVAGLVRNKSLRHLNLEHNRVGDLGAKTMGLVLLQKELPLETLLLSDNDIRGLGGAHVGQMLGVNARLLHLDLSLNRIGDLGAQAIFDGLAGNTMLKRLNLACNEIGPDSVRSCCAALRRNTSLTTLILYGNAFGEEAGAALVEAFDRSKSVLEIDARTCQLLARDEEALAATSRRRLNAKHMELVEAEDARKRREIQARVKDKIAKSHGIEASNAA